MTPGCLADNTLGMRWARTAPRTTIRYRMATSQRWPRIIARGEPDRLSSSKSIDIEIMSGCNLALIELPNLFQHLLFATRFTALLCARLVATWVLAVV